MKNKLKKTENVEVKCEKDVLVLVYSCDFLYLSVSNVSLNSSGRLGSKDLIFKILTRNESKYSNSIIPIIVKKKKLYINAP
tara:strand:- start:1430 stop:1672 length:243 start_codon:yes stop_codon:yes gene_type:complete